MYYSIILNQKLMTDCIDHSYKENLYVEHQMVAFILTSLEGKQLNPTGLSLLVFMWKRGTTGFSAN